MTCSNRSFGSASGNVPPQNRGSVLRTSTGKLGSLSGAGFFFQLPLSFPAVSPTSTLVDPRSYDFSRSHLHAARS